MRIPRKDYQVIAIGVSAGGLNVMTRLLEDLPVDYPVPIVVVQHRSRDQKTLLEEVLQLKCRIRIKQADEKERPEKGRVYFAPSDYHLLFEEDGCFSLSCDQPVNYSRPSIDVFFETAAEAYESALLAIILTGASNDGARGLKTIRKRGGTTIAQKPETAEYPYMPRAAIEAGAIQYVMELQEIKTALLSLMKD